MHARKMAVLRLIAEHDGEWYWYQIDRSLSAAELPGPFMIEIDELVGDGLVEVRDNAALGPPLRYWLTETGMRAVR